MDVQGSQYHLVAGLDDWGRCVDAASGTSLAQLWASPTPTSPTAWEYDPDLRVLRLRRDTPLFRRAGRRAPIDPETRRGAGRDGFGSWYWIDADRRTIRRRPASADAAATWWSVDDLAGGCAAGSEVFVPVDSGPPPRLKLQGLTVTTRQYLVVGYRELGSEETGLLVFDLRGGGAPLRMPWPPDVPFNPWDLADPADGGLLVLDAENSCYWRLDEHLRLRTRQSSHPALFQPVDGVGEILVTDTAVPTPILLRDASGALLSPVSIEPGPGDSVLILDADAARGYSTLYCFDGAALRWTTPMRDVVEVIDPADPASTPTPYSVLAHDFCYLQGPPATGPLPPPLLYLADAQGQQVIAFTLDPQSGAVRARDDFLPMRRWAGRALVRSGPGVWYDFGERFVSLEVFTECRFASTATLVAPAAASGVVPGETFDSRTPGCVWHRLFLDAQLPTGTRVTIRARAADDPDLLPAEPWLTQPVPYLRSDGPELPWQDVWADRRQPDGTLPDATGTWELLFQRVTGQYLQLEVTIEGGGRSSPLLRSLRAWYPRFSYPEHYLPAVYPQNDGTDRFLERYLANVEGFYTALEERIEHSHLILDARTAPAADLPWLASWFGLALDPLWDLERRRFLIRHVDTFYRRRGTISGLVAMLRLFLDPVVDDSVFDHGGSAAAGVRVVERFLTRDGAAEVRQAAHRFDVLVPAGLPAGTTDMVTRIVTTGKPAHTAFQLIRYDELFTIGRARLGIETGIGRGPSFTPMVTGSSVLAAGYLGYSYPFDITDRVVSDRDRVGTMPAL